MESIPYLREWEEIIDSGVKFPLHVVYYEDLHKVSFEAMFNSLPQNPCNDHEVEAF